MKNNDWMLGNWFEFSDGTVGKVKKIEYDEIDRCVLRVYNRDTTPITDYFEHQIIRRVFNEE